MDHRLDQTTIDGPRDPAAQHIPLERVLPSPFQPRQRKLVPRDIEDLVASIRRGEHDGALVYRKGLRKDLDAYTATSPPHVVAARKLSQPPGSLISYLMTTEGPEPQSEQVHPIDYQHYLERQLQPIAEPVLDQLGLQFAKVIGDDTQLDLF